jgi:nitroreductase
MDRRQFLKDLSLVGLIGGIGVMGGCVSRGGRYEDEVRHVWRHSSENSHWGQEAVLDMIRYATLAPSSHNTQCWRFLVSQDTIEARLDLGRRCSVVDPDNHHMAISLGAAIENLQLAAGAARQQTEVQFDNESPRAIVKLTKGTGLSSAEDARFQAIPRRQSTRGLFDGQPLTATELKELEASVAGFGIGVIFILDKPRLSQLTEMVLAANTRQVEDPEFVRELLTWIRFSEANAVKSGDGLFTKTSGNPTLPDWLGKMLFPFVFSAKAENTRYEKQIASSAGLAVFVSRDHFSSWIPAGRAFQRFALTATKLGIRTAHLNQPVEVPSMREQLRRDLDLRPGERPDLVIRFGKGPTLPYSLRRPVRSVVEFA